MGSGRYKRDLYHSVNGKRTRAEILFILSHLILYHTQYFLNASGKQSPLLAITNINCHQQKCRKCFIWDSPYFTPSIVFTFMGSQMRYYISGQFLNHAPLFSPEIVSTFLLSISLPSFLKSNLLLAIWHMKTDLAPWGFWQEVTQRFQKEKKGTDNQSTERKILPFDFRRKLSQY